MSRVLITGGEGYIGSHTAFAFLDAGYEVFIIDNYSAKAKVDFPREVRVFEGNCGDRDFVKGVLAQSKPEAVLHFAGSISVPESISKPEKYYLNNTVYSFNLIAECLAAKVENFVFSSTAAAYGVIEDGIAVESAVAKPICPYGWSKLMVEQILEDISVAHNFNYAAFRYFNVSGADQELRTGQSSLGAGHLVKVACEVALGLRPQMEVFGTDYDTLDGTCLRDYIHVSDLAQAHLVALKYIQQNKCNRLFNCGTGKGFSVREVINAVEAVEGVKLNIIERPCRAGDPPKLIADPTLFHSQTNWSAKWLDIKDIVGSALAWERKLLNK